MFTSSSLNTSVSKEQHRFPTQSRFVQIPSQTQQTQFYSTLSDFDKTVKKGKGKD